MDLMLRCNNHQGGYCRKDLRQEAYMTICSHIFCKDCVQKYSFQDPSPNRQCLACENVLASVNDVVLRDLRPPEEQREYILSGCDPNIIMDCAAKATRFWNYQMSTEIAWQAHLAKEMTTKYQGLHNHASKVVEDANADIKDLQNHIQTLNIEKEATESRLEEVVSMYKEKSQRCQTVTKLYEALKHKVQAEQTRGAAAISAEHTLQSMSSISRPDYLGQPQLSSNRPRDSAQMPIVTHTPLDVRSSNAQPQVERLHLHQRSGGLPRTQTSSSARPSVVERVSLKGQMEPHMTGRTSTARTPARVTLTGSTATRTFSPSIDRHAMSKQFTAEPLDKRGFERQEKLRHEHNMQQQYARERIAMTPNLHSRMPANRGLY